ncbi:MAG: hypothetical protein ACE5IR_27640 [bacterium]
MSKGHNVIIQTGRGISIDELNHICNVADGFLPPDDSEPESMACGISLPRGQGGHHE